MDGLVVGSFPEWPEVSAIVEAAGAVLAWDVLSDDAVPAARIHDPDRAADWLWEIYGPAADGILGHATEVTVTGDSPVRDACRVLARLNWVEAWWPASATAGISAVDPVVLLEERVTAVSTVEHLLDDPDAEERAQSAVATPVRSGYALAAGTVSSAATTVLTGSSAVDWTLVPAGVVDAAAPADWAVLRRDGTTVLEVSVAPGPRPESPLSARFADLEVPLDVPLDTVDGLGRRTGSTPVPATVLLLPPDRRTVTVYAPGFAEPAAPAPGAEDRRAAIIAHARARIGAPDATRTERTAR